jgi:hypothetical protein
MQIVRCFRNIGARTFNYGGFKNRTLYDPKYPKDDERRKVKIMRHPH